MSIIFYQPAPDGERSAMFPQQTVWLDPERCMQDCGVTSDQVIKLKSSEVPAPVFVAHPDEIALWMYHNMSKASYEIFVLSTEETIHAIKTQQGDIQLRFYSVVCRDWNELFDRDWRDTWSYSRMEPMFQVAS